MQLRQDPGAIAVLTKTPEKELCLAMCDFCSKFHKFDVGRLEVRDEALKKCGWSRWKTQAWICEKCG